MIWSDYLQEPPRVPLEKNLGVGVAGGGLCHIMSTVAAHFFCPKI